MGAVDENGDELVNDYALLFFQPSEECAHASHTHTHPRKSVRSRDQGCRLPSVLSFANGWVISAAGRSIKMLFHSSEKFTDLSLLYFAVVYFVLACVTYGIAVPSGLFVPSLLAGAAVGRLYGEMVQQFDLDTSNPGVYSMIGAAAVLGGMSRMTISLTVIIIEATNDYTYGLPLMLTLITSRWIGNLFNEGLYDIHIHLNCVPLLESESLVGPWEQSRAIDILLAKDVMNAIESRGCLRERETVESIITLLQRTPHNAYTIVEETCIPTAHLERGGPGLTFIGLITRRQLCLILDNGCYGAGRQHMRSHRRQSTTITSADLATAYPHFPPIGERSDCLHSQTSVHAVHGYPSACAARVLISAGGVTRITLSADGGVRVQPACRECSAGLASLGAQADSRPGAVHVPHALHDCSHRAAGQGLAPLPAYGAETPPCRRQVQLHRG